MSSVEALEQPVTETAPVIDTGAALDTELDGIWDRAFVTNGADRGEGGKFASRNAEQSETPEQETEPATPSLEGETGEESGDGSTPATGVPPPANWKGREALWDAIPAEKRADIAAHQNELHARMSEMGRQVSTYKPLQDAATEFAEYFNSNLVDPNTGQSMSAADGVRYLANIQRSMDRAPLDTLLSIADTYGLREKLAEAFGGQVQTVPQDQRTLLNEIAELKRTISGLNDPAKIEQVLEKREVDTEISRFAASKPLYAQVENDLPFFIKKAKTLLGDSAARGELLEKAYELAVQADPALRSQTEAAKTAAAGTSAKAEAAKRANSVNVTSTSSGKARAPSLDDELSAIWDKSRKA
jgi:hypothetical protein